jgi:hypothetical protein
MLTKRTATGKYGALYRTMVEPVQISKNERNQTIAL